MIIKNIQEFRKLLSLHRPLICVDYGIKKTGMAVSNQECTITMPVTILSGYSEDDKIAQILALVNKYFAEAIVVGLPVSMDGSFSQQTKLVEIFAQKLELSTALPIYMQDERLTTKAADSFLKSFGLTRKQRNNMDDGVSASMILETVLQSIRCS